MYNDKREFYNYNYDKNENYIIYLDITQLLPYNNKNAYLFKVVDANADITSRNLEDEVDKTLLRASILKLNQREKNIMEMRFGFITGKEKTQKEVADELRNIAKLHIKAWEKDNKQDEKGHFKQNWIVYVKLFGTPLKIKVWINQTLIFKGVPKSFFE